MTILLVVAFSLLRCLAVVAASGLLLFFRDGTVSMLVPRLIHFSTGALLGAALFGLLPEAAHSLSSPDLFGLVLAGLFGFFLLEKLLLWRHCHNHDCSVHATSGPLLLIGDSLHNFGDGIVIAAAFVSSTTLGIVAALSTVAHELPKELGEIVVYLHHGYSRWRAFWLNLLTGLATLVGALVGVLLLAPHRQIAPAVMALSASGFLYVALADLIPGQRGRRALPEAVAEVALLAAGVGAMRLLVHGH